MIWNYSYNRPYDECRELTVSPETFKANVEQWIAEGKEQELLDATGEREITSSLESVGYNLHQFMLTHAYNMISDKSLREYFVVYMCLAYSPSKKLLPYNMEEHRLMGDIDVLYRSDDYRWGSKKNVSDFDIYCRLYFCESEQDVWDIFADGIGEIDSLYRYYIREDEDKALKVLLYIYGDDDKFMRAYTGKSFKACPESVKEKIVSILINDYFGGMYDEFFDNDNIDQAKLAWNTGILEIRQEFVRDEHALAILKEIL